VRAEHNPGDLYQPIRLPGQHADGVTGLYYNRHRYYESGTGGYINQDPMGPMAGINLDKYVANPLQWIDVLGLQGWASVPMFNGSHPGNQGALSKAMELTCSDCSSSAEPSISDESLRKFGVPSNKDEWAAYLSTQSDYFGAFSAALPYYPPLAPAAPVFGAISAAADAGSKMLKPPPNIIHLNDAVLDIAAAHAPGGFVKDIGFTGLKKFMNIAMETPPPVPNITNEKSCLKSNY